MRAWRGGSSALSAVRVSLELTQTCQSVSQNSVFAFLALPLWSQSTTSWDCTRTQLSEGFRSSERRAKLGRCLKRGGMRVGLHR